MKFHPGQRDVEGLRVWQPHVFFAAEVWEKPCLYLTSGSQIAIPIRTTSDPAEPNSRNLKAVMSNSLPAHTHHHTPSHTITHHHTPSHTITHHHTPSHTITHHHTPSHTITHHHTPIQLLYLSKYICVSVCLSKLQPPFRKTILDPKQSRQLTVLQDALRNVLSGEVSARQFRIFTDFSQVLHASAH